MQHGLVSLGLEPVVPTVPPMIASMSRASSGLVRLRRVFFVSSNFVLVFFKSSPFIDVSYYSILAYPMHRSWL